MTAGPVSVLVVDDHPVFRRGLRAMLGAETWIGAVHEAATGADAVRLLTEHPVDVVALDIVLPDANGVDLARDLFRVRPTVKVLVLSMTDDDAVIAAALRAGARGYLLKEQDPDDVVAALRTVASGGFVLGSRIGAGVLGPPGSAALPPPLDRTSPRERDLLAHLAAGHTNAQIARALGLCEKTVRNQMSVLFAKIGVRDRVGAALLAREARLSLRGARPTAP